MRERWLSRRAILAHLAILIWFPGCLIAGWWQVTVALSGDSLGYLYSVEWPIFALFGAVVWWNIVHDSPDAVGARALARLRRAGQSGKGTSATNPVDLGFVRRPEEEDAALANYNDYLASLAASDKQKSRRR